MTTAEVFGHAEAWPWLAAAPLAWLGLLLLDRARARRLARLAGPRVRALTDGGSARSRAVGRALLATGILAAVVAALEPLGGDVEESVERRGVDLVVCLDVSRSMLARDVDPDRLTAAKREVRALAERARGDRLGLVVFAGEARLAVPLTTDASSFAGLVDLADPGDVARGGTDLGAALAAALRAFDGAGARRGAVLLATDGEDHEGRGLAAARLCRERGIVVHAAGFGTATGGKVPEPPTGPGAGGAAFLRDPRSGGDVVTHRDDAGLARLAEAGGGAFVDAAAVARPLVALYDDRVTAMEREVYAGETRARRENRFQFPLAAAFLLWVLDLALTGRRRR